MITPDFWAARRVLITGHTGFKGSWSALWLQQMGAQICGIALPPLAGGLFELADLADACAEHHLIDIRDADAIRTVVHAFQPQVILHLAAQPLVRLSYREPVTTFATNVMGTVNLLEAARTVDGLEVFVAVTSDKCYQNREWVWGYRENDPMGGDDPYSASKGCAELAVNAWQQAYFRHTDKALVSVRAGNVIGGGDWAEDRLIPDVMRAFIAGEPALIRNPEATGPWQHVLDPIAGYLMLAEHAAAEPGRYRGGWNFGPDHSGLRKVRDIADALVELWPGARWQAAGTVAGGNTHEAGQLTLDIAKAHCELGWRPTWDTPRALRETAHWYRAHREGRDMRAFSREQIADYANNLAE